MLAGMRLILFHFCLLFVLRSPPNPSGSVSLRLPSLFLISVMHCCCCFNRCQPSNTRTVSVLHFRRFCRYFTVIFLLFIVYRYFLYILCFYICCNFFFFSRSLFKPGLFTEPPRKDEFTNFRVLRFFSFFISHKKTKLLFFAVFFYACVRVCADACGRVCARGGNCEQNMNKL